MELSSQIDSLLTNNNQTNILNENILVIQNNKISQEKSLNINSNLKMKK